MKYAFQHDGKAFILKAEDGSTVRVGPRHEKYDYVQGVEAGRVIGISKSGRWTNAKDYHDLYDKVSFGKSKPAASIKSKATKAKPAAKSAAKSKSSTATKKKANTPSKTDSKRIQALDAEISSLEGVVKDLQRRLSASEAKVGRLQEELEEAALREVEAQLLAAKYMEKAKAKPARPSKPKGKRRVVKAKAHVDLNWWKRKDDFWPGGRGSSDFDVRIECVKKHEYTRLTKSMTKDAITSALEDDVWAVETYFDGWRFEWSLSSCSLASDLLYDSKKGVRVRVLSIENTEYATIG